MIRLRIEEIFGHGSMLIAMECVVTVGNWHWFGREYYKASHEFLEQIFHFLHFSDVCA